VQLWVCFGLLDKRRIIQRKTPGSGGRPNDLLLAEVSGKARRFKSTPVIKPVLVRDLIVGFLPTKWVQDFDLRERKNKNKNDIIWRPLLMAFEKG
jgi:hypothetical protein